MLAGEVLAETVIEVTGDGHQSLSWPGHGFRLTVPAGAVPDGSTVSLAIKFILRGEFELPENCQRLSAIFWIKASQLFNRDVTLHLHHNAILESEAQCSQYKFVAGRCSQPDLPYKLVLREGGVFNPHTREASISVKQFSYYSTVHVGAEKDSRSFYIGQVFFRPYKGVYVWQVDFAVTWDIPPLPAVSYTNGYNYRTQSMLAIFSSSFYELSMRERAGTFIISNNWSLNCLQLVLHQQSLCTLVKKALHKKSGM